MIRAYQAADLEHVISVFHRSVREVAVRDYSAAQIAAWTLEPVNLKAWSERLATGGVFVYMRGNEIVGFARIDDKGYVDLLFVHPMFQRQGIAHALYQSL